jgi:predicted transcriptional regulator
MQCVQQIPETSMADTISLSFRVSKDKAEQLEQLAAAMDRPRSWLLGRALDEYLDVQAWQVAEIRKGMAEIRQGKGIPHEKVVAWLETWGSDEETEPPA